MNQKNKTIKVCYIPFQGAPREDKVFIENKSNWEFALKKILEKKNIEIHTDDILPIEEADFCLFFDNLYFNNLNKIWDLYKLDMLHKTIYIDYEPPSGHCFIHSKEGLKSLSRIFKHVITYNDDVVDGKRIIKGNVANFYSKPFSSKKDFKDKKLLVMVHNYINVNQIINMLNNFNNTIYFNNTTFKKNKNSLYAEREKVAKFFNKKCPNDFDLFGYSWSDEYYKVHKGPLEKDKKIKILSNYKFAICYDSIKNQRGYISEKIFDAFHAKIVPVYLGADNIKDYIPADCFVDRREFETDEELYNFLIKMPIKEYELKIKAINNFLDSEVYKNLFSSEASAKIIERSLLTKINDYSTKEAYKNLMLLEKQRKKTKKLKKINYFISSEISKNEIEITFIDFNYFPELDLNYRVLVDGEEVLKRRVEITNMNGRIEYKFLINVKFKSKKIKIEVCYNDNNIIKKLYLNDYAYEISKKLGLIQSNNKKTLFFYKI